MGMDAEAVIVIGEKYIHREVKEEVTRFDTVTGEAYQTTIENCKWFLDGNKSIELNYDSDSDEVMGVDSTLEYMCCDSYEDNSDIFLGTFLYGGNLRNCSFSEKFDWTQLDAAREKFYKITGREAKLFSVLQIS